MRPFAVVALVLALSIATSSGAQEKPPCLRAAEEGQKLRDDGKLQTARARFLECAQDRCPRMVRDDCLGWLADVERNTPTVVLEAREGARDVADARVSVDGQPLANALDGKAVSVDPGPHVFRFERGGAVQEQRVVVVQGEKNRPVAATFEPPARAAALGEGSPSRAGPFVVGALGVAALGLGAYFGIAGKNDLADLRATCAPGCTDAEVNHTKRELIIADVLLATGIVSIAVAAWWLVSTPRQATGPAASREIRFSF